jgi:hypothetical protein
MLSGGERTRGTASRSALAVLSERDIFVCLEAIGSKSRIAFEMDLR